MAPLDDNIEHCYVCTLPIKRGQKVYQLRDDDGLFWYAHKDCAEREMVKVNDGGSEDDRD